MGLRQAFWGLLRKKESFHGVDKDRAVGRQGTELRPTYLCGLQHMPALGIKDPNWAHLRGVRLPSWALVISCLLSHGDRCSS